MASGVQCNVSGWQRVIGIADCAGIVGHGRKSNKLVQLQSARVRFIALYQMRPCLNCVL
jgi:hypothetical protein